MIRRESQHRRRRRGGGGVCAPAPAPVAVDAAGTAVVVADLTTGNQSTSPRLATPGTGVIKTIAVVNVTTLAVRRSHSHLLSYIAIDGHGDIVVANDGEVRLSPAPGRHRGSSDDDPAVPVA